MPISAKCSLIAVPYGERSIRFWQSCVTLPCAGWAQIWARPIRSGGRLDGWIVLGQMTEMMLAKSEKFGIPLPPGSADTAEGPKRIEPPA